MDRAQEFQTLLEMLKRVVSDRGGDSEGEVARYIERLNAAKESRQRVVAISPLLSGGMTGDQ